MPIGYLVFRKIPKQFCIYLSINYNFFTSTFLPNLNLAISQTIEGADSFSAWPALSRNCKPWFTMTPISETNRESPVGWAHTGTASMALHAWECASGTRLSVYMHVCDALSIKRVVICKSALPWAGGVKLGKEERSDGERQTDGGMHSVWMTGMSVKEKSRERRKLERVVYVT